MMFKIIALACMIGQCNVYEGAVVFPSMKACDKYVDSREWHDVVNVEFFGVNRAERVSLGPLAQSWAICVPEKRKLE